MSWWLRKPSQVNYNEESDEEDLEEGLVFDSPLTSPGRPHQSASVSPKVLLQPDPPLTEEVLQGVQSRLSALHLPPEEVEVVEGAAAAEGPRPGQRASGPPGADFPDATLAEQGGCEDARR